MSSSNSVTISDVPADTLVYRRPQAASIDESEAILHGSDISEIIMLPVRLAYTHPDWAYVQKVCLQLHEHNDSRVRQNALTAIGYLARFRQKLEKHVAKPILIRGLRDTDSEVVAEAEEAVWTVNKFMKWRIGRARKQKIVEARWASAEQTRANKTDADNRLEASVVSAESSAAGV